MSKLAISDYNYEYSGPTGRLRTDVLQRNMISAMSAPVAKAAVRFCGIETIFVHCTSSLSSRCGPSMFRMNHRLNISFDFLLPTSSRFG
jgi:hypothetical protein